MYIFPLLLSPNMYIYLLVNLLTDFFRNRYRWLSKRIPLCSSPKFKNMYIYN